MKKAEFAVLIDGEDVTANFTPHVISLSVIDRAGSTNDNASIELDDTEGRIVLPPPGANVTIRLGWQGQGAVTVFQGVTANPKAKGGRGGRTISISARGMDTRGKAKEGQRRHFDNTTLGDALREAGKHAGIDVKVDTALAAIQRKYLSLENESFVAFGERLAREVGGTFKIVGDRAIFAERNGGKSASGIALPKVEARWGVNLHDYDVTPIIGRAVEAAVSARWFDHASGEYQTTDAKTGTQGGETVKEEVYAQADEGLAGSLVSASAKEVDRKSGAGTVVIEGNTDAQPEGLCVLSGCRVGVDGTYRIESVQHSYSRGGFTTTLQLSQPKGGAGQDSR